MSTALRHPASLAEALRQETRGLAADANRSLAAWARDPVGAVHEARRSIRSARALLRLLRPFEEEGDSGARGDLRAASRALSAHRDRDVLLVTFDRALERSGMGPLPGVRAELDRAMSRGHPAEDVAAARERLGAFLDRRSSEMPGPEQAGQAVAAESRRTYRRARRGLRRAMRDPSVEHLHELRKRCKDVREQARFLTPVAPEVFRPLAKRTAKVCDRLGSARDHELLAGRLAELDGRAEPDALRALVRSAERRARRQGDRGVRRAGAALDTRPRKLERAISRGW